MSRNLGIKASNKGEFYFVSYNSEDEARVSEYVQLLYKHGVTLWYDDGIRKSKKWEEELADNLEKCKAVIMFISKNIFKNIFYLCPKHKINLVILHVLVVEKGKSGNHVVCI